MKHLAKSKEQNCGYFLDLYQDENEIYHIANGMEFISENIYGKRFWEVVSRYFPAEAEKINYQERKVEQVEYSYAHAALITAPN